MNFPNGEYRKINFFLSVLEFELTIPFFHLICSRSFSFIINEEPGFSSIHEVIGNINTFVYVTGRLYNWPSDSILILYLCSTAPKNTGVLIKTQWSLFSVLCNKTSYHYSFLYFIPPMHIIQLIVYLLEFLNLSLKHSFVSVVYHEN